MINRLAEQSAIENIYHENNGQSAILILYSRTGIGKSRLTDYIFSRQLNCCYVRCQINQQEATEAKGFYISCLARALNNYAKETANFLPIEDYIEVIYKIDTNKEKIINDLLDIVADLSKLKTVKEKLDGPKKFKEDLVAKILQNDNEVTVSFLLEYVVFISTDRNITITIENIQLANKQLIIFLNELLKKTKNLFLIGEYTVINSEDEIVNLFRQFPFQNKEIYELHKLTKKELIGGIKQIANKENVDDICGIIEKSYEKSSGNLAAIDLLLKKNGRQWKLARDKGLDAISYDDAVHSTYGDLSNSQKMVLWYVVTHLGKVHIKNFTNFIEQTNPLEFSPNESLELLANYGLIKISGDYISLTHDSFFDLLKQEDDYQKFTLIANQNWLNFYRNITITQDFFQFSELEITRFDLLIFQLTLILNIGGNTNIDWMNYILSEINNSLTGLVSYSLIPKITAIFEQVVESNGNKNLIYKTFEWVVIILTKLGHSMDVAKILKTYNPEQTSDLLFLLQSSAKIATCDPSVNIELDAVSNNGNDFLYLGSQLLLLRYYRTFRQIKKANTVWDNLIEFNKKKTTVYRDVILDQVNLCSFNYKRRNTLLKISLEGHIELGNHFHYCSTLLSINANSYYLYLLKLLPKQRFLKIAFENLERVKDTLAHSHYPMHIYQNQKSIFQLTSGSVAIDTLSDNFMNAYLSCGIAGNKPLIGSNIVAVALKEGKFSGIDDYVEQLMEMSRKYSEINSEFSMYPLINCYNFFYRTRNKAGQKEVMYLLRKGSTFGNPSGYFTMIPYISEYFLRSLKYYVCNIHNWEIDFETIQKKF